MPRWSPRPVKRPQRAVSVETRGGCSQGAGPTGGGRPAFGQKGPFPPFSAFRAPMVAPARETASKGRFRGNAGRLQPGRGPHGGGRPAFGQKGPFPPFSAFRAPMGGRRREKRFQGRFRGNAGRLQPGRAGAGGYGGVRGGCIHCRSFKRFRAPFFSCMVSEKFFCLPRAKKISRNARTLISRLLIWGPIGGPNQRMKKSMKGRFLTEDF